MKSEKENEDKTKTKSEERFRLVVESAPNAILLVSSAGKIILVNSQTEKLFQYSREELIDKGIEILIPKRFTEKHPGFRTMFFLNPETRSMGAGRELFACRKDGTEFPVEIGLNPIKDSEEVMVLASIIDITERKKSQERFRLVVESAPNAMLLVNSDGKITLVNSQTEKLFQYSRAELINEGIEILIPKRFTEKHPGFRNMFFAKPETRSMGVGRELFASRKDGTEFPVEIGLNPIEFTDGNMVLASIIDITERKKSEERFRLVVESAPNAMLLVNGEGKITLVNSQTEKLFQYSREELIDQGIEILIPKRFTEKHPGFRNMFFANPETRSMGVGRELFAARKDGTEFPVEIGLNPIEDSEGMMVLASVIDITERKMQETNRLQSDFLANMSHELRTPMNAIIGFSEMLIDQKIGELSTKQLEYVSDIHASGSHLLHLINDILDISKIESGKIELQLESFNIYRAIEEVIKVIKPLADKKSIGIELKSSIAIDFICLDRNRFLQILYNLLSNAIKFNSKEGSIYVEVSSHGREYFMLKIRDTGIGIAQENLHKLFIPFVQLDAGAARRHEGTGLGLALTKKIVEAQLGEIKLESTLGEGTTFYVKLPTNLNKMTS